MIKKTIEKAQSQLWIGVEVALNGRKNIAEFCSTIGAAKNRFHKTKGAWGIGYFTDQVSSNIGLQNVKIANIWNLHWVMHRPNENVGCFLRTSKRLILSKCKEFPEGYLSLETKSLKMKLVYCDYMIHYFLGDRNSVKMKLHFYQTKAYI